VWVPSALPELRSSVLHMSLVPEPALLVWVPSALRVLRSSIVHMSLPLPEPAHTVELGLHIAQEQLHSSLLVG
jgi:hypothetical protein